MTARCCRQTSAVLLACAASIGIASGHAADATVPAVGRQAARATPDGSGATITGVDADDRTPLARARVSLEASTNAESRTLLTGADGAFSFERLPPGSYSVAVARAGYVAQRYGEQPLTPATVVTLGAGERSPAMVIPMSRAGVIAGVVFDEGDQPLVGATVQALAVRSGQNRASPVTVARSVTDDRGAFRLIGLPAGRYHVSASDPAFDRIGDAGGPPRYAPTYYPGVPLLDKATPVDGPSGGEASTTATFKLRVVQPARVSGTLRTENRRQLVGAAIAMNPVDGDSGGSWPARDVRLLPNGSFSFANVPPGRYLIRGRAEIEAAGISYFAAYGVTVEGRDVENIDMILQPGATLEGVVIAEAVNVPKPASLPGLRVRAPFPDGSGFGEALTGDVRPDGGFRIRGVMSGTHLVTVEGLEYPWVLKNVSYRGQDVTDVGLNASSGQQLTDVRITVTDVANELTGIVRDSTGSPVPNATVVLSPAAQQYWTRASRHVRAARSDAAGRYQVRGLPAGEYHAMASLDLDVSDAYRRDVLTAIDRDGTPVSFGSRDSRALNLKLTSAAVLRRTR